jgi:hypothetical protein
MGTKGYYAFKYRGLYYVFYNNSDSYPSYLGTSVLNNLRALTPADFDLLRHAHQLIEPGSEGHSSKGGFDGLISAVVHFTCHRFQMSGDEPSIDVFIEYVYTVDLDDEIFFVKTSKYQENVLYQTTYRWPFSGLPLNFDMLENQ